MGNFITRLKDTIIGLLSGPIDFDFRNKQKNENDNVAIARRKGNIIYLREPVFDETETENNHIFPMPIESNNNVIDLYKHLESKEIQIPKTTEAIVFKPQHMMDTIEIVEQMKSGRMCLVDLESLNFELAKKISTRLNNACAELNGTALRIGDRVVCYASCDTLFLSSSNPNEYKTSSK